MEMWHEIMSVVISNGIFAVLFVLLFFYQIKDSKQREEKYQNIIDNLSVSINVINDVKEDVNEIKDIIIKGVKHE